MIPQNKRAAIIKVIPRFVLCLAGILTGEAEYLTGMETEQLHNPKQRSQLYE